MKMNKYLNIYKMLYYLNLVYCNLIPITIQGLAGKYLAMEYEK